MIFTPGVWEVRLFDELCCSLGIFVTVFNHQQHVFFLQIVYQLFVSRDGALILRR